MSTKNEDKETVHPGLRGARTVVVGIVCNATLALIKGLAGVVGNSYALIADAIESTTDIFASGVVWFGLRVAARPPDDDHPHGHGKAEPMATVAVGLFLFAAAVLVGWQSITQIRQPHEIPAVWTLLVLVMVVVTKEILFRYVDNVGEDVASSALKGDAWHHRSDALTSGAAFIGIAIAIVGNSLKPDPRWSTADDWAALFASFVIAFNGWSILRPALYELSDATPNGSITDETRRLAVMHPEVIETHKCVARKMGFEYYLELDILVDPELKVRRAHEIAHEVQESIKQNIKPWRVSRVLIHVEPFIESRGKV